MALTVVPRLLRMCRLPSAPNSADQPCDETEAWPENCWPQCLFEDPAKQPRIVDTAEEFLREVLTGDHLDRVVVLRDGCRKLGLAAEDVLPQDILAPNFFHNLQQLREKYKFRVSHRCDDAEFRDVELRKKSFEEDIATLYGTLGCK